MPTLMKATPSSWRRPKRPDSPPDTGRAARHDSTRVHLARGRSEPSTQHCGLKDTLGPHSQPAALKIPIRTFMSAFPTKKDAILMRKLILAALAASAFVATPAVA